jgi:hypothetical protein
MDSGGFSMRVWLSALRSPLSAALRFALPCPLAVAIAMWLLIFCRPLLGQVYLIEAVAQSCADGRTCQLERRSGTCIAVGRYNAGKEVLLTAGHVVEGKVRSLRVQIDGQWHDAARVGISTRADVAAIGIDAPRPLKCLPLAAGQRIGQRVTLAGFPGGVEYRARVGRVTDARTAEYETVIDIPVVPGESGGAVITEAGELLAIISATFPAPRPKYTLAVGPRAMRAFFVDELKWGLPKCGDGVAELPHVPEALAPPNGAGTAELLGRIAALEQQLDALRRLPGPAGPAGPPGAGCDCDAAALDALRSRLSAVEDRRRRVQVIGESGEVIDEESYRLDEPIQLRLIPRR